MPGTGTRSEQGLRLHYHATWMRPKMAIFLSRTIPSVQNPVQCPNKALMPGFLLSLVFASGDISTSRNIRIRINVFFLFLMLPFMLLYVRPFSFDVISYACLSLPPPPPLPTRLPSPPPARSINLQIN